jgi:hypothetical protein
MNTLLFSGHLGAFDALSHLILSEMKGKTTNIHGQKILEIEAKSITITRIIHDSSHSRLGTCTSIRKVYPTYNACKRQIVISNTH